MDEGQPQNEEPTIPGKQDRPPLYLPEGSVRAILAMLIVGTTCFLIYTGTEIPEWWTLAFSGTVAAYYVTRNTK